MSGVQIETQVQTYVARSKSGKVNKRESATPLAYAIDVDATYKDGSTSKIWGFFATKAKAQVAAEKAKGERYAHQGVTRVRIVEAYLKGTAPWEADEAAA